MKQYLLSVHSGAAPADAPGEPPPPEQMQEFMRRVMDLEAEMEESGAWVFGGRLSDSGAATVVRAGEAGAMTTDGPFVESKEHIAGFYIINAADDDEASAWAARVTAAIGAPIELRPFVATGRVKDR